MIEKLSKEDARKYLEHKGFVFIGTWTDNSIDNLRIVIKNNNLCRDLPRVFNVEGDVLFLMGDDADMPSFFQRSQFLSNININGTHLSELMRIVTIREYFGN